MRLEDHMKNRSETRLELNWTRLLGFDQARRSDEPSAELRLKDARLSKIGSKSCTITLKA